MMSFSIKRGDVIDVDLFGATRTEKKNDRTAKWRPCVVVQNDVGNGVSPLTIVVPLTGEKAFKNLPVQVQVVRSDDNGLTKNSVVECGHIRSVDRAKRMVKRLGSLSAEDMRRVDKALKVSLGLDGGR